MAGGIKEFIDGLADNKPFWVFVGILAAAVLRYGATWVIAFMQGYSAKESNVIARIQLHMDNLQRDLDRKEAEIQSLIGQQTVCKSENERLEKLLCGLREEIHYLRFRREDGQTPDSNA